MFGVSCRLAVVLFAAAFGRELLAAPPVPLRVRATETMAPCAASAARAYTLAGGPQALVETGALEAAADVLVGSGIELTRALESGAGRDDSDVAVVEVPWVLVLSERAPSVKSLEEAAAAGVEIEVLKGPISYEAQRVLAEKTKAHVREQDASSLRKAEAALVPVSVAGPGRRITVDVPALRAQAAVGSGSRAEAAARAFVAFLASEAGRRSFAACTEPAP